MPNALVAAEADTVRAHGSLASSFNASNIVTCIRSSNGRQYIVGIGDFFPSDDHLGEVLAVEDASPSRGTRVLQELPRVTHLEPADLNGDGKTDFALSIFGNLLGRFSWFQADENSWKEDVLFDRPGTLKSIAHDFNADGRVDLAFLVAQSTEALIICTNLGAGKFAAGEIFRKPPSYGHTDFELADMNNDGHPDLVVANGDNADFQTQPRPYQGIRIYLADGAAFREAYFFPFCGVYRVLARDFDGDGDNDLASVSFFPDYAGRHPEAFVYLENNGNLQFKPSTFEDANRGRWLAMDADDLDGDGDKDIVLGAMAEMPDNVPAAMKDRWMRESPSVLVLKNQSIKSAP